MILEVFRNKPYYIFVIISILLYFVYYFTESKSTLVLNLKDTYFIISRKDTLLFFIVLFGLIGITYFLLDIFKVNYPKGGVWFYLIAFSGDACILFYINRLSNDFDEKNKTVTDLINAPNFNLYLIICIMILLVLKFFFLINIFALLIQKIFFKK